MTAIKFSKDLARPVRRGFLASLLMLLGTVLPGIEPQKRRPMRMIERGGWFLDASDR
jgi:hypothetical protein